MGYTRLFILIQGVQGVLENLIMNTQYKRWPMIQHVSWILLKIKSAHILGISTGSRITLSLVAGIP